MNDVIIVLRTLRYNISCIQNILLHQRVSNNNFTMTSTAGGGDNNENLIVFDVSKNERKLNDEFKILQRKLKAKWKCTE